MPDDEFYGLKKNNRNIDTPAQLLDLIEALGQEMVVAMATLRELSRWQATDVPSHQTE